jgi:two-component system, OmpR family, sensor histidine kinase KdpD
VSTTITRSKTVRDGRLWRLGQALKRDLPGVAAVAAVTALGLWLGGRADLTNVPIAFLFVIAVVSMRFGYQAAVFAAIASALCFDYFFLPPYGSLRITRSRDLLTDIAMFAVAVLVSTLNERLRREARAARLSERRTESLYSLVRELADAHSLDSLNIAGMRQIESAVAEVSAHVLIRDGAEGFKCAFSSGGRVALETEGLEVANWAAVHLEPAGQGTKNLPLASACYVPLVAARGCVGVLALRSRVSDSTGGVRPSSLIHSMARQLAMAIERTLLSQEKHVAEIEAETERIRNAVLSSVSHDLRTPLTVITSASSTLVERGDRLQGTARAEMARLIHDEAERLSELLKSLLDLTRLQSGALSVNRDWESLEEVVASALRRVDERTGPGTRQLRAHVPNDLPLLQLDAILIEQVLMNLIDNALTYSRTDFPVEIDIAARGDREVLVSVIDRGRGIPSDDLRRIFDKFYRGDNTAGQGLGLGLTLARGIVEAHGGKIWATETPGGGLTVQFTLPITGTAPRLLEPELHEKGTQSWGM